MRRKITIQAKINNIFKFFEGKKTYIVSICGIIGAIFEYYHGKIGIQDLVTNIPTLLAAMTLRHGIHTESNKK
jgi:hypothetical protein